MSHSLKAKLVPEKKHHKTAGPPPLCLPAAGAKAIRREKTMQGQELSCLWLSASIANPGDSRIKVKLLKQAYLYKSKANSLNIRYKISIITSSFCVCKQ